MKQKLIVIEGLDGPGKAAQAQLLSASLREQGFQAQTVPFPDPDSPSAAWMRTCSTDAHPDGGDVFAASSVSALDRYAGFKQDWMEAYLSGVVVADRYTTSSAIHQCSRLGRAAWDRCLEWLFHYEYALLGIPEPTIVIYLRVDPEMSLQGMRERHHGEDLPDFPEDAPEDLRRRSAAADYCASKLGWRVVECCENGIMRSDADIQAEIRALVQQSLTDAPREKEPDWRMIDIKTITHPDAKYGSLSFVEGSRDIPFAVRRAYWITKTQAGLHRGFHAHKRNSQLLFCPSGVIDIVLDDGEHRWTVRLDEPGKGLVLLPGLWREMIWQEDDAVLCVLASEYYDPDEYIRDYDAFLAYKNQQKN